MHSSSHSHSHSRVSPSPGSSAPAAAASAFVTYQYSRTDLELVLSYLKQKHRSDPNASSTSAYQQLGLVLVKAMNEAQQTQQQTQPHSQSPGPVAIRLDPKAHTWIQTVIKQNQAQAHAQARVQSEKRSSPASLTPESAKRARIDPSITPPPQTAPSPNPSASQSNSAVRVSALDSFFASVVSHSPLPSTVTNSFSRLVRHLRSPSMQELQAVRQRFSLSSINVAIQSQQQYWKPQVVQQTDNSKSKVIAFQSIQHPEAPLLVVETPADYPASKLQFELKPANPELFVVLQAWHKRVKPPLVISELLNAYKELINRAHAKAKAQQQPSASGALASHPHPQALAPPASRAPSHSHPQLQIQVQPPQYQQQSQQQYSGQHSRSSAPPAHMQSQSQSHSQPPQRLPSNSSSSHYSQAPFQLTSPVLPTSPYQYPDPQNQKFDPSIYLNQ